MLKRLILLFALCAVPSLADAACSGSSPSLTAASPGLTDVVACITASVNGDTINIPAGSATWSSSTGWTNKQIWLKGAGEGQTIITRAGAVLFITLNAPGTYNFRVSDMTILGTTGTTFTVTSQSTAGVTKGWRFDHLTIDRADHNGPSFFAAGVTWGLIDHVTFTGFSHPMLLLNGWINIPAVEFSNCIPQCLGYTYLNRPVNFGSDEAVYFEDNTMTFSTFSASVPGNWDSTYGGSYVARYNTCNHCFMQQHSAEGNRFGALKFEVYKNVITGQNNFTRFGQVRAGTGVVYNNQVNGFANPHLDIDGQRENTTCLVSPAPLGTCSGANSYDGNIEASGWPCVNQCGTGGTDGVTPFNGTSATLVNAPIYSWKNGTQSTCISGGTCDNATVIGLNAACGVNLTNYLRTTGSEHSNGNVDYVNNGDTAKPGYTAYTYPHPLQGAATPPAPDTLGTAWLAAFHGNTFAVFIWPRSTDANHKAYNIYRCTYSGACASLVKTITPASAAAAHSPETQWIDSSLYVADTYYYSVSDVNTQDYVGPATTAVGITVTGKQ